MPITRCDSITGNDRPMANGLIFLIGYMGSGKSTIGRLLAKPLKKEHVDLDHLIESTYNRKISEFFSNEGEEYFRKIEKDALHSLKGKNDLIVSTGGGCAAYSDNMKWMNANGTTIYLRCHPGILFHRLAPEKNKRPLIAHLEDVAIMEFILENIKSRLPYYIQATCTVNADKSPDEVVENILQQIEKKITSSSQD